MGNKRPLFQPNNVFHVYNHGNAEDNIFLEDKNYRYFLKRYAYYIYPIAKTYAFCLLPNHFHFMVRVRSWQELASFFGDPEGLANPQGLSNKISHRFGTLLNAYAKAFNSYYDRSGSLFKNTTRRKPVENQVYFKRLITYIHQNPVRHGFVDHPCEWPFSSYHLVTSGKKTRLEKREVLDWFDGRNQFIQMQEEGLEIDPDKFY